MLGPNGAGKSTAFNILTGFIQKSSGDILINQQVFKYIDSDLFAHTGICP